MKYIVIAVAAMLSLAGFANAQQQRTAPTSDAGKFVQHLKSSGNFEILSSGLALTKSESDQIKKFAQKMIDDHKAADQKLDETLKQANLPEREYEISEHHMDQFNQLKVVNGARFDRQYIQDQIQGHKEVAELLEFFSQRGDNAALKQLASTLLPTIQEHMKMAEELRGGGATARR
jgi:putative membrane protein